MEESVLVYMAGDGLVSPNQTALEAVELKKLQEIPLVTGNSVQVYATYCPA
jgi:hypothetical protein